MAFCLVSMMMMMMIKLMRFVPMADSALVRSLVRWCVVGARKEKALQFQTMRKTWRMVDIFVESFVVVLIFWMWMLKMPWALPCRCQTTNWKKVLPSWLVVVIEILVQTQVCHDIVSRCEAWLTVEGAPMVPGLVDVTVDSWFVVARVVGRTLPRIPPYCPNTMIPSHSSFRPYHWYLWMVVTVIELV